jgi:putative ATPase
MKGMGYGAGYRYDHAEPEAIAAGQDYLPETLRGAHWYEPGDQGFEREIAERLARWKELRAKARPTS